MPDDPIAQLVHGLEREGKPPLAWMVRYEPCGREPVWEAWNASQDAWAMVQLLMLAGRSWWLGPHQLVDGTRLVRRTARPVPGLTDRTIVLGEEPDVRFLPAREPGTAEEIRRRVPRPPSLDVILRAVDRARLGAGRRAVV